MGQKKCALLERLLLRRFKAMIFVHILSDWRDVQVIHGCYLAEIDHFIPTLKLISSQWNFPSGQKFFCLREKMSL